MSELRQQIRSTDWLLVLLPARLVVRLLGPDQAHRRAQAELERVARERYRRAIRRRR